MPEAVNSSAELIFGIARRLPVVSEVESFFVEADAVMPARRFKK